MVETTTIRVSRKTLETLERLREKLDAENLDQTIQALIKKQRRITIERAFALDRGKIGPFTEEDRGENRS